MAEIELVIKIDKDIYEARQHWVANPKRMIDKVDMAIANGTPLPEGHGRLIDADELNDYFWDNRSRLFHVSDCRVGINKANTIIEADKGGEE